MRITPADSNRAISYDEIEIELEGQFKNERPLNIRTDWVDYYLAMAYGLTLNENNASDTTSFVDPSDLEMKVGDREVEVDYLIFRNSLVRFFNQCYGISVEETVDFESLYSMYVIFVLSPLEYMVKFVKGYYRNQLLPAATTTSPEEGVNTQESSVPDITAEAASSTGDEHLDESSKTYDTILRVISDDDISLEFYLEMINLFEPGNVYVESVERDVVGSFNISVDHGDLFRNGLLKPYLNDPANIEQLLIDLDEVK
jgi:hypothetical protein